MSCYFDICDKHIDFDGHKSVLLTATVLHISTVIDATMLKKGCCQ